MNSLPRRLRPISRVALAAACASTALITSAARAQNQTVVITGNPLGRDSSGQAASVLSGNGLSTRRAGTLGETLDGLPGVAASGFGPNSSRPVIRGLDGDRVRLLDNGGASIDASNLSFDHASASDPLITERIEVLRGPAALLYGGNATGGVVNSIDNRIPRGPADGLSGRAEVRFGGPANERSGAALLEGGSGDPKGGLVWHVDAYGRRTDDQRVPRHTPVADGEALPATTRVRNSASQSEGGAVGAAWTSAQSYVGASLETSRNRYGVTVEPDVTIRMQRDRLALAGDWRALPGFINHVTTQASHTRYEHREIEGSGVVGTTFRSSGDEVRVTAHHEPIAKLGGLHGVFGLQAESLDFQALGEEAFVPATQTRSAALFMLEELPAGPFTLTAGGRIEKASVASAGDEAGAAEPRFGSASKREFTPHSLSLGARIGSAQGWQLATSVGQTERTPAYYELYANGLHVATSAYEQGDPTLGTERSGNAELVLSWTQGAHSFKATAFHTRFSRFISLDATGDVQPDGDGHEVPVYAFRAARARMQGLEVEGRTRVLEGAWTVDLTGGVDTVRGDNLDTGEPLPRLAPSRVRVGVEAAWQGLRFGANWRALARQDRVPATDVATPGYSMLDLWASGRIAMGEDTGWFARVNNVGDKLALNSTTIATMRGLSPLPGRALTVGLRARF